eukprot:3263354-Ditylum_brightwellii.AAC.1
MQSLAATSIPQRPMPIVAEIERVATVEYDNGVKEHTIIGDMNDLDSTNVILHDDENDYGRHTQYQHSHCQTHHS